MLRNAVVAAVVFILCSDGASSQESKIRKLVVPFPPGSATDTLARLVVEHIGRTHGASFIVENRPGAGTVIATESVAHAAPDGDTILIVGNALLIHPHLRKLRYDPLTSFEAICDLAMAPQFISVNARSPYRTLTELIDAARAKPGEVTLASLGPASATHIAFENLKRRANVDMTFVPFPGNAPAANALLGGHVTASFTDYASVAEQYKAGTLRPLATAWKDRIELTPDVPTVAESGYSDYETNVWLGIFAPAKTPQTKIAEVAGWFASAIQASELRPKLPAQGLIPVGLCGVDFASALRQQYDDYARIIREAGIKAE